MTTDLLSSAPVPGAEAVSGNLTPWDKVRAARAMLEDYRSRKDALYDQIVELDTSIFPLEQTYHKLVNAAVDHELSQVKGK